MGNLLRRAAFAALLAVPAVLCGTSLPARAELTPEQSARILEVKNNSQKIQADAAKILSESQSADAQRAAQQVIDNCQNTYNRAEAILIKN